MPIYEYRCEDCGRRSSFLVLNVEEFSPVCRHCGGKNLTKLISKVAFLRSEQQRWERLADPSHLGDIDEGDPRSMARWMKKMGKELGEDLGEDFDQLVEEAIEEQEGGTQEDLL